MYFNTFYEFLKNEIYDCLRNKFGEIAHIVFPDKRLKANKNHSIYAEMAFVNQTVAPLLITIQH